MDREIHRTITTGKMFKETHSIKVFVMLNSRHSTICNTTPFVPFLFQCTLVANTEKFILNVHIN